MSANIIKNMEALLMRETPGISEQGEQIIQDFIHDLTTHEDLKPKTLKE